MSKKILIISSSPRKGGNSDMLCDRFMMGAIESGNIVEKVNLVDLKINYCTGCEFCVRNDHSGCLQKDDMALMINKLKCADIIVLATPIYFYTMCGQLKTFIDRCCSDYTTVSDKEFYFIMTAADGDESCLERTIEEFRGFTDCLSGAKERGIIYGVGAWKKGDITDTKAYDQAFKMGKSVN